MFNVPKEISFGIYACSAEDSSFWQPLQIWKSQTVHGRLMTVSNQIRSITV